MKYLILSTYPIQGSRNSGDDLIAKSLVKLLKNIKGEKIHIDIAHIADVGSSENLMHDYRAMLAPALRPTVKDEFVAPKFRNDYLKFAHKHNIPFYAIGSGWKQYPGTVSQAMNLKLDSSEIKLFKTLFNQRNGKNNISCRDIFTESILKSNGISCYGTTGDLGLFDFDFLGLPPKLPDKIENIAVSMPHNKHHFSMAYELALKLRKRYSCNVKLVFHGYAGNLYTQLSNKWSNSPIEFVDLSGGAEKLNYYDEIDLHVGFRLHAHIWFLRTRKPSLLIAEDGRSTGHLATVNGFGYSAASKTSILLAEFFPDEVDKCRKYFEKEPLPDDGLEMLEKEINSGYETTKNSLLVIDNLWKEKMNPLLNSIPD